MSEILFMEFQLDKSDIQERVKRTRGLRNHAGGDNVSDESDLESSDDSSDSDGSSDCSGSESRDGFQDCPVPENNSRGDVPEDFDEGDLWA